MDVDDTELPQNAATDSSAIDDTNVPSLKSICVKLIATHINSIDSFGSMPWHIIKLVLEDKRCTPEILRRLENQSPLLKEQDQDIWKKFFFEKYPEKLDGFHAGEFDGTSNWRRLYDDYAKNDEDKLTQAALRLREMKERKTAEKRERELQRTDKAPPTKRGRWGEPTRPKTLLEKARSQTMKTTAVYRIGPSSNPISSPASSSLARGSVAAKPPVVGRKFSTSSTISTASSSSTAVSNVSSVSSSSALPRSRNPPSSSPSKSPSPGSSNIRPVTTTTIQSRMPARSATLPNNTRTPSFSPPAISSITQSRLGTSSPGVKPSTSQTHPYSHSPGTSMADLIMARSRTTGGRDF